MPARSALRPTSGVVSAGSCRERWPDSGAGDASSAGSDSRMRDSSWRTAAGRSSPNSSRRMVRKVAIRRSASGDRPLRCSATTSSCHGRSRNGCSATSASSSATIVRCSPSASRAESTSSRATVRSSSRRRTSARAHSRSANSAYGRPEKQPSARSFASISVGRRDVVSRGELARLEAPRVDGRRAISKRVAGRSGDDVGLGSQHLAQPRDVALQHRCRVGRLVVAPQLLLEAVGRHDVAVRGDQHRQDLARLRSADGDDSPPRRPPRCRARARRGRTSDRRSAAMGSPVRVSTAVVTVRPVLQTRLQRACKTWRAVVAGACKRTGSAASHHRSRARVSRPFRPRQETP